MPDSITVNVVSPEIMEINSLTLDQGIINHSVTHQNGGSDELLHNLLGGLQGGTGNNYYHLTSGEYANLVTGVVIRPSDTGAFYPASNPSGYITGVNISGYVTGDVVRPSDTGNFITTSQTGAFYPVGNPSGYITGMDLSAYVTGDVVRPSETGNFIIASQTGAFYPISNPSGYITGIDLSAYVTGDVVRPNETGDFITNSQTGAFYPISNPSGFITGVNLSGYVTGNVVRPSETGNFITNSQTGAFYASNNPSGFITGVDLSFSGNYYTKNESESRYVNTTGAETILGNKTFHDNVYINNLYVTGLETIVNTTNFNVESNYLLLNLTGGAVDGGIFFVTGSGLTGINDSGAIIGFDHSDKFKFGIGTRGSDLSVLDTIASFEDVTGISGGLQTQISTLNNQTGSFYPRTNPSGYITGINNLVFLTGDQTISGAKTFASRPTVNSTGILLSGEAATQSYVTGISGSLQTQISTLNNQTGSFVLNTQTGNFITTGQTGQFYSNSNPSGYITGIDLSSYATINYTTGISGGLQTQITNLSNATGSYVLNSQTGAFYPTSNPSGFVTGSVVRPSETGNFITNSQTGAFYPVSNPSGYIASSQTGAFYPASNPSGFITGFSGGGGSGVSMEPNDSQFIISASIFI